MMTRRDPSVNVLRTTIAVFAAGLGGADSITVLPHTAPLGLPDRFARRLARNTQLILLEEAGLAKVSDAAAGSGALTSLTQQLCARAWSMFQDIEQAGGAWAALEAGIVQRHVATVRAARMQAMGDGTNALIGTTAFPNLDEAPAAVLDVPRVVLADENPGPLTIESLPRMRLAEPYEALRDASDNLRAATGQRPAIFLATLGRRAQFSAAATFAGNFFAAGGIAAVGEDEYDSGDALIASFVSSGARIACVCAADKMLAREGGVTAMALRAAGARSVYVASASGQPQAAMATAGFAIPIRADSNGLATLQTAWDHLTAAKGK
jgi:methylmalonyl-CoA mutase